MGLGAADLQQRLGNRGTQQVLRALNPQPATRPEKPAVPAAPAAPTVTPAPAGPDREAGENVVSLPQPQDAPAAAQMPEPATAQPGGVAPIGAEQEAASSEVEGDKAEKTAAQASQVSQTAGAVSEQQPTETQPSPEAPAAEQAAEGQVAADGDAKSEEPEVKAPSPRAAIAPAARAVAKRAQGAQVHTPAPVAAGSAQAAAIDPATEQRRSGAAGTIRQIDDAEAGDVDRRTFKQRLKDALREAVPTPRNEAEAEQIMEQGAGDTSAMLQGEVGAQSGQAAAALAGASAPENEVSPDSQPAPPASELQPEAVGDAPAPVSPASVVPDPLPASRLDYSDDSNDADALMAENRISRDQLERGRDPDFDAALGARGEAEAHQASVPGQFRETEVGMRASARNRAAQSLGGGLADIHGTRAGRITNVGLQQAATQTSDSADRIRITGDIERIKTETREAVETILGEMETEAAELFEAGLKAAEKAYEDVFEEEKGGFLSWLGGSITGSWDETVERAFRIARRAYEYEVDLAIDEVATFVENKLADAKARVVEGRDQIDLYVSELDDNVAQYGEDARAAIGGDFDAMVGEIDSRRDGLVDGLAQQYAQSQQRIAAKEEELRAANKSLWDRVYDATVGVVQKVLEFKNMLLGILARAAAVVEAIIDDPIGFLGNLISGIKAGLDAFVGNIGEHLKQGLMGWLFGAIEGAGIKLPSTFDLKGIIDLVLQVLGLTYANIRKRAVRILGEETVSRLEQVAEIFKVLVTEGPAGLWRMLVEKLGDIKETILGEIRNWVITKIIVAGVKWIVSLLNPASAFIKACMMIYDIVKFFIERGQQIISLVNAVINALGAIVAGNIAAMASAVEGALARMVPVAISFMAALLGLGGISDKIRQVIEAIQEPINKAIDWVINKAVALVRKAGQLFSGRKEEPPAAVEQTQAADDDTLRHTETFSMAGAQHSLVVEERPGELFIGMASGRIQKLAFLASDAQEESDNAALDAELEPILQELVRLQQVWDEVEKSPVEELSVKRKQHKQSIIGRVATLTNYLVGIGRKFGLKNLTDLGNPSKFQSGGFIKEEHRKKIRSIFYRSHYQKQAEDNRDAYLASFNDPNHPDQFVDQITNAWEPKSEATIDHKLPVVKHWNKSGDGGHNLNQTARLAWYSDISNHQITARKNNSSEGGKLPDVYQFEIGPNFRGPGEDGL